MGRPLNKKYFGNRNIGTGGDQTTGGLSNSQNYNDDRIGGEGVGSVTIDTEGTYTSGLPTATFSTPNIPGGVRATGVVHGHGLSAATTSNGTGYLVGDVLTVTGGTRTSAATFPVASVVVVGVPTVANGGSLIDVTGGVGDRFEFTHANLTTSLIVEVTAQSGGAATTVEVVQAGVWNGTGAPTTTSGFTRSAAFGGPTDNNGTGLVLNLAWGVYAFGTVAVQGDYTVAPSNPVSFSGGTGSGAAANITFGVSGVAVSEKGSGYTTVSDAAITFSSGSAAATPVLTTDSGVTYAAGNQENAIIASAQLPGGSDAIVDIISQRGARRFRVTDGTRIGVCALTASATLADGEMSITATDAAGNSYYITKLAGRKATLTQVAGGSNYVYATGEVAPWRLVDADGLYVKINNA